MSNLSPQVRQDKDGNFVTRWIRSITKKGNGEPPAANADTAPAIEGLWDILKDHGPYSNNDALFHNITIIHKNDPELLNDIIHVVRDNSVERGYWEDKLNRINDELIDTNRETINKGMSKFRLALTINPFLRRIIKEDPEGYMHQIEPHLHLDALTEILEESGLTNPPTNLLHAITLINHVKEYHTHNWDDTTDNWGDTGGVTYEEIKDDAAYIAEHLDQAVDLLPELQARDTVDRNLIAALLNNEAQSLREGEL